MAHRTLQGDVPRAHAVALHDLHVTLQRRLHHDPVCRGADDERRCPHSLEPFLHRGRLSYGEAGDGAQRQKIRVRIDERGQTRRNLGALGLAQATRYGPGVTDAEISIGQTMPYSGPASAYAAVGRAHAAFFAKINAEGGIKGRRIRLISLDDGMSPPRTVEQVRRLVEEDRILLTFGILGPGNFAIQKYLNARKVPHLFPSAASLKLHDPQRYPWSMGWTPSFDFEGRIYANYLLQNHPDGKIAVLYQNDDMGREYLRGFRAALGARAATMVVAEASYELSDATVDSQIIKLHASRADTLFSAVTPKFGSQAIRRVHALNWRPLHFIGYPAASVGATLAPAGLDKAVGLISAYFARDVSDPANANDPDFRDYAAWFRQYVGSSDMNDGAYGYGYMQAHLLVQVFKQCGDDLSRENVMRQAANLRDLQLPLVLPGVRVNTSPTDYRPIENLRMYRFDGRNWKAFGPLLGE
jgi:branched-chain amino acid transport system substrate-binding protein